MYELKKIGLNERKSSRSFLKRYLQINPGMMTGRMKTSLICTSVIL